MTLTAFTTTRRDGPMRAPGALVRLLKKRHLPGHPATAEQVHRSKIAWVKRLTRAKKYRGADGLLTAAGDQPLVIFTADCVPVFLSVPSYHVAGLLHCGWRGVQQEILKEAVTAIRSRYPCSLGEIHLWTGPCIGDCCFEVKWDVARYFPRSRRRFKGAWSVNLEAEIAKQARRLGIRTLRRRSVRTCTMHTRRFYSFRLNGTAQRQASIILQTKV